MLKQDLGELTPIQRLKTRFSSLPANVRGGMWVLMSAILFTGMSTLAKFLGGRLDSFQVVFFRAFLGMIFVLPFLLRAGVDQFKTKRPIMHICRGITGSSAMICGFYAIVHLPLADAIALNYARPLFLVILAVIILREVVGMRRALATIVGFVGVIIMLRPTGTIEPASFVAILGAALVAGAVIFVKILSRTESTVTLLFYSGVISTIMTAIPAYLNWTAPTLEEFGLLMAMGLFGVGAHSCFIRGYAMAEATAMAPYDYSRLIFSAIAGFIIFDQLPDAWGVTGAAIIVGSTFYITLREARKSHKHEKPVVEGAKTDGQ